MKIKNILKSFKEGVLSSLSELETQEKNKSNKNVSSVEEVSSDLKSQNFTKVFLSEKDILKEKEELNNDLPFVRPLISTRNKSKPVSPKIANKIKPSLMEGNNDYYVNKSNSNTNNHKSQEYFESNTNNSSFQASEKYAYYSSKANSKSKTLSAFVSYVASPESLQVYINKQKVTIFINGISHADERSSSALTCKKFLDDNFKKKTLYFDPLETLNEHCILANVFYDKNKTINIAEVAKKHGFNTSDIIPLSEDDLVIPENKVIPKYSKENDINLSNYSDAKIIEDEINSNKNRDKSSTPVTPLEKCFEQHNKIIDKNNFIGLLIDHGHAPYLFEQDKSKSYFIKLQLLNKEIYLWGKNLPDALSETGTEIGDFIHLHKNSKFNEKTRRTYNIWEVNLLEKSIDKHLFSQKKNNQITSLTDVNTFNNETELNKQDTHLSNNIIEENSFVKKDEDNVTSGSMDFLFDKDNPFLEESQTQKVIKRAKP